MAYQELVLDPLLTSITASPFQSQLEPILLVGDILTLEAVI